METDPESIFTHRPNVAKEAKLQHHCLAMLGHQVGLEQPLSASCLTPQAGELWNSKGSQVEGVEVHWHSAWPAGTSRYRQGKHRARESLDDEHCSRQLSQRLTCWDCCLQTPQMPCSVKVVKNPGAACRWKSRPPGGTCPRRNSMAQSACPGGKAMFGATHWL